MPNTTQSYYRKLHSDQYDLAWVFDSDCYEWAYEKMLREYKYQACVVTVGNQQIHLKPFEFIFGYEGWAKVAPARKGVTPKKLRRLMDRLKTEGVISLRRVENKCSVYFFDRYHKALSHNEDEIYRAGKRAGKGAGNNDPLDNNESQEEQGVQEDEDCYKNLQGQAGGQAKGQHKDKRFKDDLKKERRRSTPKFTERDLAIATTLAKKVFELTGQETENLESWANMIRLARDKENRTYEEIEGCIEWAYQPGNWWRDSGNFCSPQALRPRTKKKITTPSGVLTQYGAAKNGQNQGHNGQGAGQSKETPSEKSARLCAEREAAIHARRAGADSGSEGFSGVIIDGELVEDD